MTNASTSKNDHKYHNIIYTGNNKWCEVYNGQEWIKTNATKVIANLQKRKVQDLQTICNTIPLADHQVKKLTSNINKFDKLKSVEMWVNKNQIETQLDRLIDHYAPRDDTFNALKKQLKEYENDPCCKSPEEYDEDNQECLEQIQTYLVEIQQIVKPLKKNKNVVPFPGMLPVVPAIPHENEDIIIDDTNEDQSSSEDDLSCVVHIHKKKLRNTRHDNDKKYRKATSGSKKGNGNRNK